MGRPHPILAIDIVLEPDRTMLDRAEAVNARLVEAFPSGFVLGDDHRPHISLLQRFVDGDHLQRIVAAVGDVLGAEPLAGWQLQASRLYYLEAPGDLGLAGIVIDSTEPLRRLQQGLIDAVAPFTVERGSASAFVTTPAEPSINQPTIDYIAAYVPEQSGDRFNPHVTVGLAERPLLEAMLARPFDGFTFSPESASLFQLGNFGTAAKELHSWALVG